MTLTLNESMLMAFIFGLVGYVIGGSICQMKTKKKKKRHVLGVGYPWIDKVTDTVQLYRKFNTAGETVEISSISFRGQKALWQRKHRLVLEEI